MKFIDTIQIVLAMNEVIHELHCKFVRFSKKMHTSIFRRFHVLARLQRQGEGGSPVQGPRLREQHRGGQVRENVLLPLPLVQPPRLLLRGGGEFQGRSGGDGDGGHTGHVKCKIGGQFSILYLVYFIV